MLMPPSSSLMPSPGGDSTMTTKGDLLSFGAEGKVRVPVGADGLILRADSTAASGLAWAADSVSQLTTKGDLLAFGSAAARLPIGTNDQVLVADSAQTYGVKWGAVPGALTGLGLNNALAIWDGTGTLKHHDEILTSGASLALTNASALIGIGAAGSELFLSAAGSVSDTGVGIYQGNTAHVLQLRSTRADGSGNVSIRAVADVNAAALTADHKVFSFAWLNNTDTLTELWHLRGDGELRSSATTTATIAGAEANGATAIGLKVSTTTDYTTAGAKLLSVQNNGTEKFYVDKDGYVGIGSGALVLNGTSLTLSGALAIGVTPAETKSLVLRNSTAAAVGAQQYSPSIYLAGQGWETTTSTSDEVVWRITNVPVQGTAASSKLVFSSSLNGAAYADKVYLDSAAGLMWSTDGGGDIGGAGANRPGTIRAATQVEAPTVSAVNVATTSWIWAEADKIRISAWTALGLGAHGAGALVNSGEYASVIGSNTLTDTASAVVAATVYDRNAASITNATTMRIHSFGWTNNVDAYTELASVRADGAIYALSFNGTAATSAIITGAEADGATAIGVKLNTSTAYSTGGSKLLSVQNNGTEKAYLTYDGLFRAASSLRAAGDYGSGEASTLTLTSATAAKDATAATLGNTPTGIAAANAAWLKIYVGTTVGYVPYWTA